MVVQAAPVTSSTVVVAVDVGKTEFAFSVTDVRRTPLNPAHVTEQRRVLGKRTVKTDVIDLQAMTELLLAGRGQPARDRSLVLGELTAWSAHRSSRAARTKPDDPPSEVAYVSVGARHLTASDLPTNTHLSELRPPEPITHACSWT